MRQKALDTILFSKAVLVEPPDMRTILHTRMDRLLYRASSCEGEKKWTEMPQDT